MRLAQRAPGVPLRGIGGRVKIVYCRSMGSRTRLVVAFMAALCVAAVVLFVAARRERQRTPGPPMEGGEPARQAAAAPNELELAEDSAAEIPDRTALEPAPTAEPDDPAEGGDDLAQKATEGLLRINVVARETREPLPGVPCVLFRSTSDVGFARQVGRSRGRPDGFLITDATGLVEYLVPQDVSLRLWVNPFSERTGEEELDVPALRAGEERSIEIALATEMDRRSYGRVIDEETEAPIAGAIVSLCGNTDLRVESAPDGIFELPTATWRDNPIRVEKAGYATVSGQKVTHCEDPARPCEVRLSRAAALLVEVTDALRAPLEGVVVRASMVGDWCGDEDYTWSEVTDARGACALELLPARTALTVELLNDAGDFLGREVEPILLDPGECRPWTVIVGGGAIVEGIARDGAGAPERRLEVWLYPEEMRDTFDWMHEEEDFETGRAFRARSNEVGRFVFENVPSGRWRVGAASAAEDPRAPAALTVPVVVVEGEPVPIVTLTVWRGLYLQGEVRKPDGSPAASRGQSRFSAYGTFSGHFAEVEVNGEGRFVLGPLLPGEYRLVAWGAREFAESEPLLAQAGEEDLVLVLREGARISGRVVDSFGQGVRDAEIAAISASGESDAWSSTGEQGDFEFGRLVPGIFCLVARSTSGDAAWMRDLHAYPGQERMVDLQLAPGARLQVRVQGAQPGDLECQVISDGLRIARARFNWEVTQRLVVPPGPIEIRFVQTRENDPLPPEPVTLEVAPGEEREFVFDLERAPQ